MILRACLLTTPNYLLYPLCGAILLACSIQLSAQGESPVVIKDRDFVLTDSQAAAGIDGRLKISLKVDKDGSVKDADIIAGPIWPCGKNPKVELDNFKTDAKKNAMEFKFAPALKDGKPTKSTVVLTVIVGNAFKASIKNEKAVNSQYNSSNTINESSLNGRAIKLPKPVWPIGGSWVRGAVSVDVIIDTTGNILAAGVLSGPFEFQDVSREAACAAKFEPTLVNGIPVYVSGTITYAFTPKYR